MFDKALRLGGTALFLGVGWMLVHMITWMIVFVTTMVMAGLYEVSLTPEAKQQLKDEADWLQAHHHYYFIFMYSVGSAIVGAVARELYVN